MKSKTKYVCNVCQAEFPKWMGQCGNCGEWNTLEEKAVLVQESKAAKAIIADTVNLTRLSKPNTKEKSRTSTGFSELDGAMGGGFVSEQVVLLSGEPGVGKSTLLLQVLINLVQQKHSCLYVSGEESVGQVARRAARLVPKTKYEKLNFLGSPGVHGLIAKLGELKPKFVVIDSIQTLFDENLNSLPGSLSQVKACTSVLVRAAKSMNFTLIIVGHINKEGAIAGPKVLEHLVDTVLQIEGEQISEVRMVRVLKNRFGPTGELGLMVMTEGGLTDIDEKYNIFGGSDRPSIGAAKTLVVEGNRPIVVQVQALVNTTVFAYPKRVAEGLSVAKLQLICAILERFAGIRLGDKDVYVRTAGGYKLHSTSADLAIAAAIISSTKDSRVDTSKLYVGEISLSGRVSLPRSVSSRLDKVDKFGIKLVISGGVKGRTGKTKLQKLSSISELSKFLH